MSVVLAVALGYIVWIKWCGRRRDGRRRPTTWYGRPRTEYYELERRRPHDPEDDRRRRRYGVPDSGRSFGVTSGVSPISPGPVRDRRFK